MAYTESEIKKMVQGAFNNAESLYKEKFINYTGKTTQTKIKYSEVIAHEVLNNLKIFDNIKPITRSSSYKIESHHDGTIKQTQTNRQEEIYAKKLFQKIKNIIGVGEIIDFQVPLKDKKSDKAGKVDLISLEEKNQTLYIIELKYGKNKETLLRAVLEAYTYYKTIDTEKLIADFNLKGAKNIKPAVMVVHTDCNSYCELEEMIKTPGYMPELRKLGNKLGITFFISGNCKTFQKVIF